MTEVKTLALLKEEDLFNEERKNYEKFVFLPCSLCCLHVCYIACVFLISVMFSAGCMRAFTMVIAYMIAGHCLYDRCYSYTRI